MFNIIHKQGGRQMEQNPLEIIHAYTRSDAIADGSLVDVSAAAKKVGFSIPVALTRRVWESCVAWDEEDTKRQVHQDEGGRLRDVLHLCCQVARHVQATDRFYFPLCRVPRGGSGVRPRLTRLKALIAGGDQGEPVVTIMHPDED